MEVTGRIALPFKGWRYPGISDAGHFIAGEMADRHNMARLHRYEFSGTFNELPSLDLPRVFDEPRICATAAGDCVVQEGSHYSSSTVTVSATHTAQQQTEGKLRAVLPGDLRAYAREKNGDSEYYEVIIVDAHGQNETRLLSPPGQKWSPNLSICSVEEKMAVVDYGKKRLDIYHNNHRK